MYPNQPYVSGMFQQAISNMQGQVPAIQQYLQQNPNLTDLQYYQAARQANISPLAIAMATNSDPMQIYNRYQTAQQQFQQMQPQQPPPPGMFNQAAQRFGEDQALQAVLMQTPLAPVAPFVGPIRTGVRLLGGLF